MTASFRSVHIDTRDPEDGTVDITGARSVHGDTEGTTPGGYYVNTGSYVHVDDVAAYMIERAASIRASGNMLEGDVRLTPEGVADVWESFAQLIRSSGV